METHTISHPAIQKMRFLDVFDEDKNENLTLKINLIVKDESFVAKSVFQKGEKIGGVDFHLLRYLDLALTDEKEDFYKVAGCFPKNQK